MKKKRAGILTWHYYPNFGSALQAYALQKSIEQLGYAVKIIDYRNVKYGKVNRFKQIARILVNKLIKMLRITENRRNTAFIEFQRKFFRMTRLVQKAENLSITCKRFDVIICGSDQIWAPNVLNLVYMLNFVPDNKKKISYAASIGLNNIPDELVPAYTKYLSRFQELSVREKNTADLLKKHCNLYAKVVLDPTMLIDVRQWMDIESKTVKYEKYVFCYFLNDKHHYADAVCNFVQENGYKVVGVSANRDDSKWMDIRLSNVGPREFLSMVHYADAIITDSYHGTIFSLLYHKDFISIERFSNGEEICQNSRIYQLSTYFDLKKQIISVSPETKLSITPVNYDEFEEKRQNLKRGSIDFLKNALES